MWKDEDALSSPTIWLAGLHGGIKEKEINPFGLCDASQRAKGGLADGWKGGRGGGGHHPGTCCQSPGIL